MTRGSDGRRGRRVIRGPWAPQDPAPGPAAGPLRPLVVAVAVAVGTLTFLSTPAPLLRLVGGHRHLTQPALAGLLPGGARQTLDDLLVGLDHLLVGALMLLILGWGAAAAGFGGSSVRRGLPAALFILLAAVVLWSLVLLGVEPSTGWWSWDLVGTLASASGWVRGVCEEVVLRGVLQAALIVGLHRLMARERPGLAVGLGIVLAAVHGAVIRIPFQQAAGLEGGALAHATIHEDLLPGLVLGAVFARTGDLVLTGALHGACNVMRMLAIPGWPATAPVDFLLGVALVMVAVLLARGLLTPHSPDETVRRARD